jgi:extracellular factor (EF) 3-hydroxypalmitic acid methyl ester biosynthesis protein
VTTNAVQPDLAHYERENLSLVTDVVDGFQSAMGSGQRVRAMEGLFHGLTQLRGQTEETQWKPIAVQVRDALAGWTTRDLLTFRCVAKPRGYAGDAPTLDVIYRHPAAPTLEGSGVHEDEALTCYTTSRPASVGVRFRRQILADAIDATAARVPDARCLSLACGHLREAELSHALASGGVSVMYAVDQDAESLAQVTESYPRLPIEPVLLGVRELLRGARPARDLDLAYSAGLYDYLPDDVARRTTAALFDMLRSGGKVLVANFAPTLPDIGYMESCMDWWLTYRTDSDMKTLAHGIDPALIQSIDTWKDQTGHIEYLEIARV